MAFLKKNGWGLALCLVIAVPSWALGTAFPLIGGAVIAIIAGMMIAVFLGDRSRVGAGIKFASSKVLHWAVILLGFGLNLTVVLKTGALSLPIIVCTIATSLIIAYALHRLMHVPSNTSTLVGVGSSICGGSAIAATAPVINADDEEVAQAIAVIFFFNILAAILFPLFGTAIGFDTTSGAAFGMFAGTAINDTSSVTAAAATWDSMYGLGSQTLDTAVTVKLTRTLAIIPIVLILAFLRVKRSNKAAAQAAAEGADAAALNAGTNKVSIAKVFPFFILYFIGASIITTIAVSCGVDIAVFNPVKELCKFLIVVAMAAIGLNTNIAKLVRTGGKPLIMGACCWVGITGVSLAMQHLMGIW